ncbi:DUF2877 domain-containing protein [Anaeromicrobium sediminis]|nr:DUF2877 domain-containing protein [Anaeromicrobium sediminis]
MDAKRICSDLKRQIEDGHIKRANVHSVFNRAINLMYNHKIISILNDEEMMGPMTIVVDNKKLKELHIRQNDEVRFNEEKINFSNSEEVIFLQNCEPFNLSPNFSYTKDSVKNILSKLDTMEDTLYKLGNLDGIGSCIFNTSICKRKDRVLDEYSKFILPRIKIFLDACRDVDIQRISRITNQIIGFGPGLTPSTDDFLLGVIISFIYLDKHFDLKMERFNRALVEDIENKTTLLSENLLYWAAKGKVGLPIKNVILSILSKNNEAKLKDNLKNLLKVGGTSGTDISCGIYVAFKIIVENGGVL